MSFLTLSHIDYQQLFCIILIIIPKFLSICPIRLIFWWSHFQIVIFVEISKSFPQRFKPSLIQLNLLPQFILYKKHMQMVKVYFFVQSLRVADNLNVVRNQLSSSIVNLFLLQLSPKHHTIPHKSLISQFNCP